MNYKHYQKYMYTLIFSEHHLHHLLS